MAPKPIIYQGMHEGDLAGKDYACFWQPQMEDLPPAAVAALRLGQQPAKLAQPFAACAKLLRPGYAPMETGYSRLASGEMQIAVLTQLPRTSAAMIDWWFSWHGQETQRYKLWHPNAHLAVRQTAGATPDAARPYIGETSHVTEVIGGHLFRLAIAFVPPERFGLTRTATVPTAVCAELYLDGTPIQFGRLVHLIRKTPSGCEMRSRFWIGGLALGRHTFSPYTTKVLGRLVFSEAKARALLTHCAEEMQHLASFLPELYAQQTGRNEHDQPSRPASLSA